MNTPRVWPRQRLGNCGPLSPSPLICVLLLSTDRLTTNRVCTVTRLSGPVFSLSFSLAIFLLLSYADRPCFTTADCFSPRLRQRALYLARLNSACCHPAPLTTASAFHRSTYSLRVLAYSGSRPFSLQELPPSSLARSLRPGYLQYHHQTVRAREVVHSSHTASLSIDNPSSQTSSSHAVYTVCMVYIT